MSSESRGEKEYDPSTESVPPSGDFGCAGYCGRFAEVEVGEMTGSKCPCSATERKLRAVGLDRCLELSVAYYPSPDWVEGWVNLV